MLNFIQLNHSQYTIYTLKVNATAFKKVNLTCRISFVQQEHDKKNRFMIIHHNNKNLSSGMDLITKKRVISKRLKKNPT